MPADSARSEPVLAILAKRLGAEACTVPGMLGARAARTPHGIAQWQQQGPDGDWLPTSWREFHDRAERVADGLLARGLACGQAVGIMATGSPRWDIVQMGVLAAGGVVVGLDPGDIDENLCTIARRCDIAGLVVATPAELARFDEDVRSRLQFIVCLDSAACDDRATAYAELLQDAGTGAGRSRVAVAPDDPATIIFTSGTTGEPKGIRYSHGQVCLAVASILDAYSDIDEKSRLVCWLPLSNLFQRIVNTLAIACGAQTWYVENPGKIVEHLATVEPHLFIGVPRFYEKLHAGMMARVAQGPALQRRLVAWALREGEAQAKCVSTGERQAFLPALRYRLADRLVLSKLRAVMGRNLRYMVSGSAPMPVWLLERFHAMGLLVLEAYGMSENIVPVASNRLDAFRFGTVGRPMPGCAVRLAEDGELLVRGPGVTAAYLDEEQSGLLDADGYLASGDLATIDADGFITLTGRKSEIIKTATGRRIAPAGIESYLLQVPAVEHAAVFGQGRTFIVAVLAVSADAIRGIHPGADGSAALLEYCDRLRASLASVLVALPAYKRPAGLVVTTRPFTLQGGELTTNLKLRRRHVGSRYAEAIDRLYQRLDEAAGKGVLETLDARTGDVVLCSL